MNKKLLVIIAVITLMILGVVGYSVISTKMEEAREREFWEKQVWEEGTPAKNY